MKLPNSPIEPQPPQFSFLGCLTTPIAWFLIGLGKALDYILKEGSYYRPPQQRK